ncbi:DNA polymerase III subunit gamma/tau [Vallitalea guaymasensis]|uniref:DNA polymerase III subunit gamma/tau n=1 Tax=Vallitalea guaymasensis TaxID=1185412 RepID=UPI000DE3B05D|nr:DNA polymerase III subunit gamma/tau [Vallitalea guaymasensis]
MSLCLYKSYRPSDFNGLIGQESVSKTLKAQIKNKTFSQAYLFYGRRGTGKTSSARILSKAVNCLSPIDGNPCNKCENCKKTASIDIIELDAASNNSVDEIRNINEKSRYLPNELRYKVFIIDEVHMLSNSAFNAFLKTLEEPPKHCIFILCTTEMHKVPATVRSRCQIYTFREISVSAIVEHLDNIVKEMGIVASDDALKLIAQNADGSMRDALSILDQFISSGEITEELVRDQLGVLNTSLIFHLTESIIVKDLSGVLQIYKESINLGCSVQVLVNDLILIFKDMMLYLSSKDINTVTNTTTYRDNIVNLCKNVKLDNIFYIIEILSDLQAKIQNDLQPKSRVEMVLVKLVSDAMDSKNYYELLNEIVSLRKELDEIKSTGKIVTIEKSIETICISNNPVDIDKSISITSGDIGMNTGKSDSSDKTSEANSSNNDSNIKNEEVTKTVTETPSEDNKQDEQNPITKNPSDNDSSPASKSQEENSNNVRAGNESCKDIEKKQSDTANDDETNEVAISQYDSSIEETEDNDFDVFNYFFGDEEEFEATEDPQIMDTQLEQSILKKISEDIVVASMLHECSAHYDLNTETMIIETSIPPVYYAFKEYLHTQQIFSKIGVKYSIKKIGE